MGFTKRDNMHPGSGEILNEDDTTYDFTAGFRALAAAVAALPALTVTIVARLTSILANGVAVLANGVAILAELGNILVQVSRGVIDSATGAAAGISYPHHEIHAGDSFQCWYEQTVSDIGDRSIIAFKTPNTAKWLHMVPLASASAAAHAKILEAPTITDNTGAPLAVRNRDRNSANPSGVLDTSQNPDVANQATYFTEATMGNVTGGTEIAHAHLQAGSDKKAIGGTIRETNEWILKPNTLYSFEVESETDEDNVCVIELNWYEHENVE